MLKQTDDAFFEALLRQDANALEVLLGEDFTIVDVASGSVHPRAAFLGAIRDGLVTFDAIETFPEEALIREYGDVGVIVGRTQMAFRGPDGSSVEVASRYTHVLRAKSDGDGWQLVSAQGTQIAA